MQTPWEHGSEFHHLSAAQAGSAEGPPPPWAQSTARLYGSGRDALRAILGFGRDVLGWKRCWVPSYLCQEVAAAILDDGHSVTAYPDAPGTAPLDLGAVPARPGDVVVIVNHFGLRAAPTGKLDPAVARIEDHTHDPWSPWARASTADYCVASLRKTLPVADGGVLWAPGTAPVPEQPPLSAQRARAAGHKLEAMRLKARYLAGDDVPKEAFRQLSSEGESEIAAGPVSGMSPESRALIGGFPARSWRETRRANVATLLRGIESCPLVRPLVATAAGDCCPFSGVLVARTPDTRDRLRAYLIERRIYPAVLWPLEQPVVDGIRPRDIELSQRLLSIHADGRYCARDMERVARVIRELAA